MYEALADFYEEKGYFTNSPARAYRYHVLLEFALKYDGERADLYRERLTYDMYLRENVKSRPDFAADMTLYYKEEIRNFYKEEEIQRKYLPDYTDYDWKQLSKMTHLEMFRYPSPHFVLFNYQKRNPLTYEAETQVIVNEMPE